MQHKRLPDADIELVGNNRYHPALEQREQLLKKMGLYSDRAINGWLFPTENLEIMLLKILFKKKSANVYEISTSNNVGHYSTVLRGLRRMEKRKLVESITKNNSGRHKRIYRVTLLGELILYLAKEGWKGTSKRIAVQSSKFRDCQSIHEIYDPHWKSRDLESIHEIYPNYYWQFTRIILEKIIQCSHNDSAIGLEQIVAEVEFAWIKENVVEKLIERQYITERLNLLERLGNIEWIRPILVRQIEQYSEEWKRWMKTIDALKTKLTANYACTKKQSSRVRVVKSVR